MSDLIDARYQILETLGVGGQGRTVLVSDRDGARRVIKLLPPRDRVDDAARERRRREIESLRRLEHPHVIPLLDVGECPRHGQYLVFAWRPDCVDGHAWLQRHGGRPPASASLAVLAQVASALRHAHSRGVLHRDIKPANLLIEEAAPGARPFVWVIDFGLARFVDGEAALAQRDVTQGMVVGTPAYLAPEIWAGRAVTSASDVYSLGCLAIELLTGSTPFQGSVRELHVAHSQRPIPDLVAKCPALPRELVRAVGGALEKMPEDRPDLDALLRIFASAASAEADSSSSQVSRQVDPPLSSSFGAARTGALFRRSRGGIAVVAGSAAVVATMALFARFRDDHAAATSLDVAEVTSVVAATTGADVGLGVVRTEPSGSQPDAHRQKLPRDPDPGLAVVRESPAARPEEPLTTRPSEPPTTEPPTARPAKPPTAEQTARPVEAPTARPVAEPQKARPMEAPTTEPPTARPAKPALAHGPSSPAPAHARLSRTHDGRLSAAPSGVAPAPERAGERWPIHIPNDWPHLAPWVPLGTSPVIGCDGDDWFRVKVPVGAVLRAEVTFDPARGDLDLTLCDPAGSRRARSNHPVRRLERAFLAGGRSGELLVHVSGGHADYVLTLDIQE